MAAKIANDGAQFRVLNRVVAARAVSLVADDRMFQPCEVNANLMRASRFEFNREQRETIETLAHTIKCQSGATPAHDRHACAVRTIASEWLIDDAGVGANTTMD